MKSVFKGIKSVFGKVSGSGLLSARINSTNSKITVISSKPMYGSDGVSAIVYTDFNLNFTQGADNALSAEITGVEKVGGGTLTGGERAIDLLITVYGRQDGIALISVSPKAGRIYKFSTKTVSTKINQLTLAGSGILIKLDADNNVYTDNGTTLATDGQLVQQITDSISGKIFRQTTAGNKPTLKTNILNGHAVLRFDGGDYMDATTALGMSNSIVSSLIFARSTTAMTTTTECLMTSANNTTGAGRWQLQIDTRTYSAGSIPVVCLATNSVPTTYSAYGTYKLDQYTYYPISSVFNRGTNIKGYVNGSIQENKNATGTFAATDLYRIGANGGGTGNLNGDIACVYLWNKEITASEISSYSEELKIKYGFGSLFNNKIRIASFNSMSGLDGQDHFNAIRDHLNRVQADIITLVEISAFDADNIRALAQKTGYNYFDDGDLATTYNCICLSRYRIKSRRLLTNSELFSHVVITEIDVKGTTFVIYSIHLYPFQVTSWNPPTPVPAYEYTRAVEWIRINTDIAAVKTANPNAVIIVQGDYNSDRNLPQTDYFDSKPAGVPVTVTEDFSYPLQYYKNPDHALSTNGLTIVEGTTLNGNRNSVNANSPNAVITSEVRIDYLSYDASKLLHVGSEILFSEEDANTGLTKVGNPLSSQLSRVASDHRLIFSDFSIK